MDYKISKSLSITAAGIILISFFIPWTKSRYRSVVSAWDINDIILKMVREYSIAKLDGEGLLLVANNKIISIT